MMEKIIDPIDVELIQQELTKETFLRNTNNGKNEIYIINCKNAPNTLKEIGRLREITFRDAGGGTGKSCDLDEFDISDNPYEQLIVWNPEFREIVGGYRFLLCNKTEFDKNGQPVLATSEIFHFSEKFIREYLDQTIELGRSFVQPNYQPTVDFRKGMYSLDNLWDGLGAVIIENPHLRYFFGKITMYPHFNREARDLILFFINKYFKDNEGLVHPIKPLEITTSEKKLKSILSADNYKDDYKILIQEVRKRKENIPPLVNAYMNLSATMRCFGTALNPTFGNVEETAILIAIADIYDIKKERHLNSYTKEN